MHTIPGTITLWTMLQSYDFETLNLKHINQDPLENFFSQVKSHCPTNTNSSPYMFGIFKTLLTCNITSKHSLSANCERNEREFLLLLTLLQAGEMTSASTVEEELEKHTEIEEVECHNISNLVCYDVCLGKTLATLDKSF